MSNILTPDFSLIKNYDIEQSYKNLLSCQDNETNWAIKTQKSSNTFLPAQMQFMRSQKECIIYRGGIRSGKTYIGAWWSILKCMKGQSVLAIAPTYGMLVDNMIATLIYVCDTNNIPYTYNQSSRKFIVGSSYIIMRTAEKFDAIRGFEACHMWFDEISFTPYAKKAYERGLGRLSGMKDFDGEAQSIVTSSPHGLDFATDLAAGDYSELVTQRITDNWFLDPKYIKSLRRRYTGKYAAQELDAEIVDWGGAFFDISNIEIIEPHEAQMSYEVQCFDLAYTTNKKSDYSSHGIAGTDFRGDFVIEFVQQWKAKIPETQAKIKRIINQNLSIRAFIEANGTQVGYYDMLVSEGVPVAPVRNINKSKATRMFPLASAMEAGTVKLVRGDWNEKFLDQARRFSMDDSHAHDDMLDAVNMCFLETAFKGQSGFIKDFKF